jgi:hypothetical protein
MSIRIDGLDPTVNPQRDHEFPAMRDGVSNKLTVAQVLSLIGTGDIPDEAVTLAKLADDAVDSANHTFDDTVAELGETNVQGAINALKVLIDGIEPEAAQSDVRQTVNVGPVDGNGRAAFLTAGTGLECVTTGLTTTPLNLTMGDGFGASGKVDLSFVVDENLSWGSLPDISTSYLYLEWDGATLSTGHSTLAPDYSYAKPGSPATGQYWYPVDHRSRGERWSGSAWVPVLRVYVGQCTTSGGVVTQTRSYAYQGRYFSGRQEGLGSGATTNLVHNIGANREMYTAEQKLVCVTGDAGYTAGDVVRINPHGDSSGSSTANSGMSLNFTSNVAVSAKIGSNGPRVMNFSTGNWGGITSASWRALYSVERGF